MILGSTAQQCALTQLPTEIIQRIHLYYADPSLALASPILGSRLSNDRMYQQTILHAFWMENSTSFYDRDLTRHVPGKEIRGLFYPMVPARSDDHASQQRLQDLVISQPWCTWKRLQACFTNLLKAECYDTLNGLRIFLNESNKSFLNEILRISTDVYTAITIEDEDRGKIVAKKSSGLAPFIIMDCSSKRPELCPNVSPQITIRPARVLRIPDRCLYGSPWTDDKVDYLRFLHLNSTSDYAPFSTSALNKGMEQAINEGKYTALLVLVNLSSDYIDHWVEKGDPGGPEILGEHFRTVARRPQSSELEVKKSKSLFICLLRRHAESMPKSDPSIIQWASRLHQFPATQTFGQWVLDFSARDMENEASTTKIHFGKNPKRIPMFHGGLPSTAQDLGSRREISEQFQEMEGNRFKIKSFRWNVRQIKQPYE